MVKEKDFKIPFSGLKLGKHEFNFKIEDTFFELFEDSEISKGQVSVDVSMEKKNTLLNLKFELEGQLELCCDTCNEPYSQNIKQIFNLIVKFSDEESLFDTDEIITISSNEHSLFLAQHLFEFIHLSVPARRTHFDISLCNQDVINTLNQFTIKESVTADPRWDSLNKLK